MSVFKDSQGAPVFFILFVVIFILILIFLFSGLGAELMMGGPSVQSWEGVEVRKGLVKHRLKVHLVRNSKGDFRVGLELRQSTIGSFNMTALSISPEQALELARQLQEASGEPVGPVVEIPTPDA